MCKFYKQLWSISNVISISFVHVIAPLWMMTCSNSLVYSCERICFVILFYCLILWMYFMCLVLSDIYCCVLYSDAIDAETESVEWICIYMYVMNVPRHPWWCTRHKLTCCGRWRYRCVEWGDSELHYNMTMRKRRCGAKLMLLLSNVSRNAVKYIIREEQNLHETEVTLPKPWNVPDWRGSRTCGSRCNPPTSLSVTVLTMSIDAPGHLWPELTAHRTACN